MTLVEMASFGAGLGQYPSGAVAAGRAGTIYLHGTVTPVVLYTDESGGTPYSVDGTFTTDASGRVPGWATLGLNVDVTISPATTITAILGGPAGPTGPTGPTGLQGPGGPPSVNYRGVWASGTTYATNDWVKGSDGLYYFSVASGNIAHDPTTDTSETYWAPESPRSVVSVGSPDTGADAGARIKVAHEAPLNVNWAEYGADNTGAADSATAIQAALDAANGGDVYVPSGLYKIGSQIEVNAHGTRIFGSGCGSGTAGRQTILRPSAAINPLKITVGKKATIANLALDGNSVGTIGLVLEEAEQATLEKILVSGFTSHGIQLNGNAACNDVQIVNSYSNSNGGDGIRAVGGSVGAANNNLELFAVSAISNGGAGLHVDITSLRVFGGWFATNTGWGINLDATAIGGVLLCPLVEDNVAGGVNDQGFRTLYVKDNSANQSAALDTGSSSIQAQARSDAPGGGGSFEILGRNGRGVWILGGAAGAVFAAGPGTDEVLHLSGKGAGGTRFIDAPAFGPGAGTNYGRFGEVSADRWGLGHATTEGGTPTYDVEWGPSKFFLLNLPTSDPGVAGQLYSAGVPSAGVPKALMVSGG